jgi:hypothetical protein
MLMGLCMERLCRLAGLGLRILGCFEERVAAAKTLYGLYCEAIFE